MPNLQVAEDVLGQKSILRRTFARMQCKPTSGTKRTIKKPKAPKLRERDYVYVIQPKEDHQGCKIPSQFFAGLVFILSERFCPIAIFWYIKSERTRRKFCIAQDYARSRPDNPDPMYKPRHYNEKLTLRLSLNMMICTPEHGSVHMKSLFLTTIQMNPTYLNHPTLPFDQTW